MAFETPQGPTQPEYALSFRHRAITGSGPVKLNLRHTLSEESEADADEVIQKLFDLLTNSGDFEQVEGSKQYGYSQSVSPTAS